MENIPLWLVKYAQQVICENDYDGSHNLTHFINTCNYVELILENEYPNCNNEHLIEDVHNKDAHLICLYSAFCHDLIDAKYVNTEIYKEKLKNVFIENMYPMQYIEIILYIIDNISFSKQRKGLIINPKYKKVIDIVSDADKLDAYRIERIIEYQKRHHTDAKICKDWLKTILVLRILTYKNTWLRTDSAKKLAEPLHLYILNYVEENLKDAELLDY